MPNFDIIRKSEFQETFKILSVKNQFDLDIKKVEERFTGNLPIENLEWNIGVIYGASGTGKSTIAKELFPNEYIKEFHYTNKPVLEEMPDKYEVQEITKIFNSVGFATVWSWLKPYNVLSTGEKMRVDLARAILEENELIVFDEYTSVVNREVAKAGSFALQKAVRKLNKKFIAVSCHSDILEWLEPDWVFNTDKMEFEITRGLLRRPELKIDVVREKGKWELFRKYHYLNTELNNASHQYVGYLNNVPVVFFAVLHLPNQFVKNIKRGHRLVVLPDYQGLGIGHEFSSFIADIYIKSGYRFVATSSSVSAFFKRKQDKRWLITLKGRNPQHKGNLKNTDLHKRKTFSYEYIGNG